MEKLGLINKIDDEIYVVFGRVVKIDTRVFDMSKDEDRQTIMGLTRYIWDSPEELRHRPFGSKTAHRLSQMDNGHVLITPFRMSEIPIEKLRKIYEVVHARREELGV